MRRSGILFPPCVQLLSQDLLSSAVILVMYISDIVVHYHLPDVPPCEYHGSVDHVVEVGFGVCERIAALRQLED